MSNHRDSLVRTGLCGMFLVGLSITAGSLQRQVPRGPIFRTGVEQIEVAVIGRDRDGNFVNDLTLEDFELFEDGKRQDISDLVLIDLPVVTARPLSPVLPLDVATNAGRTDGRIYLLVLDDLQVDPDQTHSVRRAAREFVERHVGPNDIAAAVTTGGFGRSSGEFTQDRARLLAIIDSFVGWKNAKEGPSSGSSAQAGLRGSGGHQGGGGGGGAPAVDPNKRIQDMKDAHDAMKSMDILRRLARMMSRVPGRRKAVLVFSQGLDYNVYDVMGKDTMYASEVRDALAEAIAEATRANVAFYPIDPRGLAVAGFGEGDADGLRRSLDSLRALGDDTGGFAAINNNDYRKALARVVEENSRYYVLGYHPKEPKRDGRFHRITVKVRRPDINVVARPGYTAPDARKEEREARAQPRRDKDELGALLDTPIPVTGLAMRMQAVPFKGAGRKASVLVAVQIDGTGLPMVEKDGKYLNKVQIALIAVDVNGRLAESTKAVADLAIPLDQAPRLRAGGMRWVSRLELEPGRYHLRLAAAEVVTGRNGSVLCDVDVPDFEREQRSASGLLLTSNAAALAYTHGWEDVNRWDLPAPMTPARTFVQNDVLFAAVELYERKRPPRDQAFAVHIVSSDGAVVQRLSNTFNAGDFKSDRYVPYLTLPLSALAPGRYVLRVEARPAGEDDRPLTRALSFEVVAPTKGD